jgi:nucleotide-binding universal stress UspA family protein
MSFYRVVVPLDGSKLAESALEEALSLTNALGHVLLVTAIDPEAAPKLRDIPFYPFMGMGLAYLKDSPQEVYAKHHTYLMSKVALLQSKGIKASFEIRYGTPKDVILHAAADFNADMIVMASHGRSGISRRVIGSVAGEVSGKARRPVMVVSVRKDEAALVV